ERGQVREHRPLPLVLGDGTRRSTGDGVEWRRAAVLMVVVLVHPVPPLVAMTVGGGASSVNPSHYAGLSPPRPRSSAPPGWIRSAGASGDRRRCPPPRCRRTSASGCRRW